MMRTGFLLFSILFLTCSFPSYCSEEGTSENREEDEIVQGSRKRSVNESLDIESAHPLQPQHGQEDTLEDEDSLYTYLGQTVFSLEELKLIKALRWMGRIVGLLGLQGITPMILPALLGLVGVQVDSYLDYTIICLFSLYFAPVMTENLRFLGEEVANSFDRDPAHQIPAPYLLKQSSSLPLTIATHSHAIGMATILTLTFRSIENKKYPWFFIHFHLFLLLQFMLEISNLCSRDVSKQKINLIIKSGRILTKQ